MNIKTKLTFKLILVILLLNFLNYQHLISQSITTNDTLIIINNSIDLDTTSIAPVFDTQFEPFLEFNTRRSNLTPIADEINEFENYIYTNFYSNNKLTPNILDLPAIDIFTANKLQQFINDSLFANINLFIDSIDNNLYLNSGQKQILYNKIENLKNSNIYQNRDTKINFLIRNQTRFGEISGIEEGKFAGDELDIFQRLSLNQKISDNQSLNLLLQTKKDLGEQNLNEFSSYSLKYTNIHSNFLSNSNPNFNNLKIIVGDFVPKVGFGSVFWTSFAATKGSDVISPTLSFSKTTDQNKSTIDFNRFRGVLGEYNIDLTNNSSNNLTNVSGQENKSLKLLFWYADNDKTSTINEFNEVTSIAIAQSFRTTNEISKKNNLNEKNITANIEYTSKSIDQNNTIDNNIFGLLITNFKYNKTLNPTSSIYFLTKNNNNSSNSINLYSLYNLYAKDKFSFGSEIAFDDNLDYTTKISSQYYDKDFVFSNQLRVSSPEFRSMYGYNFGEIGNLGNQISYYNGIEYKGFKNLKFYNYFEYYTTINKINSLPNKQIGLDIFLETEYKFSKDLKLINRLKFEQKKEAANVENINQRIIFDRQKFDFRLELHTNIDNKNRLRFRYETTFVNFANYFNNETGNLAFLEYHSQLFEDLKFNTRITYFDTPSFNSAIYQYEYAMPGYTTTNAMFGNGYRLILGIEYPLFEMFDLNFRYSSTFKNNVDKLGSGDLEILGNNDSRLIFQLNYKY